MRAADHTVGEPVCISIRERTAGDNSSAAISTSQMTAKWDSYVPVRASRFAKTDGTA